MSYKIATIDKGPEGMKIMGVDMERVSLFRDVMIVAKALGYTHYVDYMGRVIQVRRAMHILERWESQ